MSGRDGIARRGKGLLVLLLLLGGCGGDGTPDQSPEGGSSPLALTRDEVGERARRALGNRDGTVLVMDPRTGRLLAVVNPRLATRQAFPPGSTIKPFLALAALESGRINGSETRVCQGGERRETRNLLCSHRPFVSPLTLTQALAHSCNDYFLALGERLGEGATLGYLRGWGFGEPTGWGAGESAGRLPQTGWSREGALGTEAELLVTPLQLLRAYQGIFNEGQLCRPSEHTLACEAVRRVPLTERHRLDILEGLRAAVKEGTAKAALPDLSQTAKNRIVLYGKTGTSGASNHFRTQGWFVGLLALPSTSTAIAEELSAAAAPSFRLAVLIFLKRASGADAAAVARPLLADLTEGLLAAPASLSEAGPSGMDDGGGTMVRLGPTPGGEIVRLPLERYLSGVLLGEAGHETELEALKAQAVVSRTFALGNLGRHATDGYDFCRTTHCQAYNGGQGGPPRIRRALLATRGELLGGNGQGGQGGPAEVYFHAACGGRTTHPLAVWGGPDSSPAHLRGVEDPICEAMAPRQWEDRLSLAALDQALRGHFRTDPGGTLRRLWIERRDRTGRVAWVGIDSSRGTRRVRGWELRLAVGRALGWQHLKSTWFDLQPEGAGYRFRGKGFGHGLGLCQQGSHLRARQGMGYRQILAHYFPGTVRQVAAWEKPGGGEPLRWVVANSPHQIVTSGREGIDSRQRFRTEGIEWDVPARIDTRQLERAHRRLSAALVDLRRRLAEAAMPWPLQKSVRLHLHETTSEFIRVTGHSGWATGVATRDRIDLQPLSLLERRGELTTTLRHELAHVVVERLASNPPPRWLAEGLALHFAGQGPRLLASLPRHLIPTISLDQLEARLASPAATPAEMRPFLAAAYQRVASYRKLHGESALWHLLTGPPSRLVSIDTPWSDVYNTG